MTLFDQRAKTAAQRPPPAGANTFSQVPQQPYHSQTLNFLLQLPDSQTKNKLHWSFSRHLALSARLQPCPWCKAQQSPLIASPIGSASPCTTHSLDNTSSCALSHCYVVSLSSALFAPARTACARLQQQQPHHTGQSYWKAPLRHLHCLACSCTALQERGAFPVASLHGWCRCHTRFADEALCPAVFCLRPLLFSLQLWSNGMTTALCVAGHPLQEATTAPPASTSPRRSAPSG